MGSLTVAEALEQAVKIARQNAQKARENVAACPRWSAAQAEWSRARDMAENIGDQVEAFANAAREASK